MAQYCLMSRSIMIFTTDSPEVVHTSVGGWLYTRQWERSILLLANLLKVLLKYLMPSLHSSSLYPCLLILQPQRLCCSPFVLSSLPFCYSNEIFFLSHILYAMQKNTILVLSVCSTPFIWQIVFLSMVSLQYILHIDLF